MSKIIPKAYICGNITDYGEVIYTYGHIYRFRKNCQKYCDKLNAEKTALTYRVLVADNWRIWRSYK